jgi:prepilin-type N-terminal cleavage/methylation domain-containing protein
MRDYIVRKAMSEGGVSLVELLIAVVLVGIIATAAFGFFAQMHNQAVTQRNVAEMQDLCRANLEELKKSIRMAGYKLPAGHPAFEIFGSTIGIYCSDSLPVDTLWYYLDEYSQYDYDQIPDLPAGRKLFRLMRSHNTEPAELFSDLIVSLRFLALDSANVMIRIETQTKLPDMDYPFDNGYRTYAMQDAVRIRNVD